MGSLSVHTKTMKYMKTDNEKSKVWLRMENVNLCIYSILSITGTPDKWDIR